MRVLTFCSNLCDTFFVLKIIHLDIAIKTWVLSKSDEAVLGVFERKILRGIFDLQMTTENGE